MNDAAPQMFNGVFQVTEISFQFEHFLLIVFFLLSQSQLKMIKFTFP